MLSFLSKFKHSQEMRESKDEILSGEIVRAMAMQGYAAVGFRANTGSQIIRFKPTMPDLLYSITLTLDRKTGGSRLSQALVGSKAVLYLRAEVKNHIADPDDLLNMYRTDMKNILKSPLFGDVKIDHQLNSVFGTRQVILDIDKQLPKDEKGVKALQEYLMGYVNELKEKLKPYKKG